MQEIWYTTCYHPETSPVEGYNRTICTAVRSYIGANHEKWDEENEVTGYSPVYVNFGRVIPCRGTYYGNSLANAEK